MRHRRRTLRRLELTRGQSLLPSLHRLLQLLLMLRLSEGTLLSRKCRPLAGRRTRRRATLNHVLPREPRSLLT